MSTQQVEPMAPADESGTALPVLIIATGAVATVAWIAALTAGAFLAVGALVNATFG